MFGIKRNRNKAVAEILGNLGKYLGTYLAAQDELDASNRRVLLDLVKKTQSYDELSDVIAKYGDDNSIALTLALILQAVNLRFKSLEDQVNILQSEIMRLTNSH